MPRIDCFRKQLCWYRRDVLLGLRFEVTAQMSYSCQRKQPLLVDGPDQARTVIESRLRNVLLMFALLPCSLFLSLAFWEFVVCYTGQDLPRVTRASSFCNLEVCAVFATSDVFFECFDDHDTLAEWESCMEKRVSARGRDTQLLAGMPRRLHSMFPCVLYQEETLQMMLNIASGSFCLF